MIDFSVAEQHLRRDPVMRRLIERHGPCRLKPKQRRPPFESLARAIAHQQLSGFAAAAIVKRFAKLGPGGRFPRAADIAALSDLELRQVGFSRAKILAIRDLALKTLAGVVPTSREMARLSDDEIIERLVQVRGIGPWTAEMLLIFQLGRPDVLPVTDYGIRAGFKAAYKLPELPTPKAVREQGEKWRPWRTAASWYLWRAAES